MSDKTKTPLIIVTGPTASGKSSVGVELALKINGAVVSADSVQVYRGMDIGSAKISEEEMKGVKHFLISELEPDEPFNVSEFVTMAEAAISRITDAGMLPIVVGGTAFYIQALLKGVVFDESTGEDRGFRKDCEEFLDSPDEKKWERIFGKYFADIIGHADESLFRDMTIRKPVISDGLNDKRSGFQDFYARETSLYTFLKYIDPVYATSTHMNNNKRVIRALEYFKATGERFSDYNMREAGRESKYDFFYFVLEDDRTALYERINARVDKMISDGLEAEVRQLLSRGFDPGLKSMQSIGYKEMVDYINEECSFGSAVESIKQNTRHFAKRQMTWFRREKDVIPIDIREHGYDAGRIAEYIFVKVCQMGTVPI